VGAALLELDAPRYGGGVRDGGRLQTNNKHTGKSQRWRREGGAERTEWWGERRALPVAEAPQMWMGGAGTHGQQLPPLHQRQMKRYPFQPASALRSTTKPARSDEER
jgi:hypothetical protein